MRAVLRLTRRNLAGNRLRFALTTFAVLLGVSFVVSSFVLTDGLLRGCRGCLSCAGQGASRRRSWRLWAAHMKPSVTVGSRS